MQVRDVDAFVREGGGQEDLGGVAFEFAAEVGAGVVGEFDAGLHLGPPVFEGVEGAEFGEDLEGGDGADGREAFGVVAAEQVRDADQFLAVEGVFLFEVGGEVAFDEFGLVEHVLVDARATEEEDVGVVGHDAVD